MRGREGEVGGAEKLGGGGGEYFGVMSTRFQLSHQFPGCDGKHHFLKPIISLSLLQSQQLLSQSVSWSVGHSAPWPDTSSH